MSQSYTSLVVQFCSHILLPILCTFVTCLLAAIVNTLFERCSVRAARFLIGIKVLMVKV